MQNKVKHRTSSHDIVRITCCSGYSMFYVEAGFPEIYLFGGKFSFSQMSSILSDLLPYMYFCTPAITSNETALYN